MIKAFRPLTSLLPDGTPLPILCGPAKGRLWLAGAAPGPSKGLSVLWNRSEPDQLRAAQELAQGKTCCFDIGAHAGLYSLIFARHAKKVCAFEPWPRNIAWLTRTLSWNRTDKVTILPWAVSLETGLQAFQEGPHSSMGFLESSGTFPVFSVSLRDFIARYGFQPELMKIDVEGAETDVLRGGIEFLRERKPALLLSTHGPERRRECLKLLREIGYGSIRPLGATSLETAEEFRVEAE